MARAYGGEGMSELEWARKYYGQAVGLTIVDVAVVPEDGENWVVFACIDKDGKPFQLELSRDPEGNGPGFLYGLPSVTVNNGR